MDNGSDATHPPQRNRRLSLDWFRAPPTDYLNVSSAIYPRGSKATLVELSDNNALVDVLFYVKESNSFLRNARQPGDCIIRLLVGDEFHDANVNSTKFAAIDVASKTFVDTLRGQHWLVYIYLCQTTLLSNGGSSHHLVTFSSRRGEYSKR